MLLKDVRASSQPPKVLIEPWSSGMASRLTDNVIIKNEEDTSSYCYDEVSCVLPLNYEDATVEELTESFDFWWNYGLTHTERPSESEEMFTMLEDALCEIELEITTRISDIEDALCELDKG